MPDKFLCQSCDRAGLSREFAASVSIQVGLPDQLQPSFAVGKEALAVFGPGN